MAKDPKVEVTFFVPRCCVEDKEAAKSQRVHLIEAENLISCDELASLSCLPEDLLIDVVVGHGVELGLPAQFIRYYRRCKWVQVVHQAHEEIGVFKEYSNPISNAQKKQESEIKLCKQSDFVVTIGPRLTEVVRRSCEKDKRFFEFTPGILGEFSGLRQVREESKTFKVLCFGCSNQEDFKLNGFDIAAGAVAQLSHCHLVFVSAVDVNLEDAKDRFQECGISLHKLTVRSLSDCWESLGEELLKADLAVMPSRTEGFGVIGLLALSAGLPILVGRNTGLGEALMKVLYGSYFVVDSDDPEVWAKAIENVQNKERTTRLRECEMLRGFYRQKYSWEEQIESLIEKLNSITDGMNFVTITY